MNQPPTETTVDVRARVNGFTEARPAEGGRVQFNAKVESLASWRFKRACSARGESYASVIERLMDVYTAQAEGTHVLHMDGNECPLSRLITGIADEARGMMSR